MSYRIATFRPDGAFAGSAEQATDGLSRELLSLCRDLVRANGPAFECVPGSAFPDIRVKLTSSNGSGLATFKLRDSIALSAVYLGGRSDAADGDLVSMFLASMRRTPLAAGKAGAFQADLQSLARPLAITVPWFRASYSAADMDRVTELGNHFAAAFFEGKWSG